MNQQTTKENAGSEAPLLGADTARIETRRDDEHGLVRPWIVLVDGIVQRNAVGHIRTFKTEAAARRAVIVGANR